MKVLNLLPLLVVMVTSFGCKKLPETNETKAKSPQAPGLEGLEKYATINQSGEKARTAFEKIFKAPLNENALELFQKYKINSVKNEDLPYPGSWYKEALGGTNKLVQGETMSALEKYDQVFHSGEKLATDWEKKFHNRGASYIDPITGETRENPNASWTGHCNGFSAAASRYRAPTGDVLFNGVTFKPYDIRALLAEAHMSYSGLFIAGKRCEKKEEDMNTDPNTRSNTEELDNCTDTNAALFHINVINWIGIKRTNIIMDTARDHEVWNYPFFKYQVISHDEINESQAQALVGGSQGEYKFNSEATKFYKVKTSVTRAKAYLDEMTKPKNEINDDSGVNQKTYTYEYVLEVGKDGKIIGGEWIGEYSRKNHPDFMWVSFTPNIGSGNQRDGNPYLSLSNIHLLYEMSLGLKRGEAPIRNLSISEGGTWEKNEYFELKTIEGVPGISLYTTNMVIKFLPSDKFKDDVFELKAALNGKIVLEKFIDSQQELFIPIKPRLGKNDLSFTLRSNDKVVFEQKGLDLQVVL